MAKPDYDIAWPRGLDEQDPDLAYPELPVSLTGSSTISTACAPIWPRSAASLRSRPSPGW
jgi:hypothetical protein